MSTSTNVESRFQAAIISHQATAVPMNAFNAVLFSQTLCIGTDKLGSCSVILILSPLGAILGHVSPLPDGNTNDPNAGDEHVRSFMGRVTDYYRQCQALFPANSSSWVVCAVYQGCVALPDQQRIMETKLREVGLTPDISQAYVVPFSDIHPDRSSVFVDSRGDTIQVYVEERLVHSIPRSQSSQTTAVTSTATASPPYTTTPSTAAPYATTPYATVSSASYSATPSASSGSARGTWQWNGHQQQYQYGTQEGVQRSQPNAPLNVWIYSSSAWQEGQHWALWNGTTMQYQ